MCSIAGVNDEPHIWQTVIFSWTMVHRISLSLQKQQILIWDMIVCIFSSTRSARCHDACARVHHLKRLAGKHTLLRSIISFMSERCAAIRHCRAELFIDGAAAQPLSFDGKRFEEVIQHDRNDPSTCCKHGKASTELNSQHAYMISLVQITAATAIASFGLSTSTVC